MKALINISFGLFLRWNDGFMFFSRACYSWTVVTCARATSVLRQSTRVPCVAPTSYSESDSWSPRRPSADRPAQRHKNNIVVIIIVMSAVTSSLAKWRSKERKWHVLDERQTSAANPDALLCNSWSKFYICCKIVGDIDLFTGFNSGCGGENVPCQFINREIPCLVLCNEISSKRVRKFNST